MVTGEDVSSYVANLLHIVTSRVVHRTFDSNIDEVEAEVLVFLAVLDEEGEVGPDFGLNIFDRKKFKKG